MDSLSVESNYSQVSDVFAQLATGERQQQGLITRMPNEILQAILRKVGEPFDLIKLRSVSSRWKLAVESICRVKKCLFVVNDGHLYDLYYDRLVKRFNGHVSLLKKITFIPLYRLADGICTLLAHLFPQVEQFFIIGDVYYSLSECFNEMLKKWSSSLTTLSLHNISYTGIEGLCAQINELANLKQLDFNVFPNGRVNLLAPTLARLEHISCDIFHDPLDIVRNLGGNFTSLGMNEQPVKIGDLTEWLNLNGQFVSNLERFSLWTYEPKVLSFICQHFSSLQFLRINMFFCELTTGHIRQLARLTNLLELEINFVRIKLSTLNATNFLTPNNIRMVSLVNFKIVTGRVWSRNLTLEDGRQFGRFLSTIFPNVEKLTVKSDVELGNLLEQHMNLFVNLREHDFGLND